MIPIADIAPELREPLKKFPTVALDRRPILAFARLSTRFARTVPTAGVTITTVRQDGVTLRLYQPMAAGSGAGMLWLHGGGIIAGDPVMDDALLGPVSHELGIVIASVSYRRAPEHPYPAAVDDAAAGWDWLQTNASRLGIDPARVALGGESAGGNLASALAQRLHDRDGGIQPRAVWLMCPMLDDRTATRPGVGDNDHPIWNNRNNRYAWRSYLGVEPGSATVPAGSVPSRRKDLTGLPPTWIGIASLDLFAEEDLEYARRLREAGVPTEVDLVPGALHGFQAWGANTNLARDYLARARTWLGSALTIPGAPPEVGPGESE